MIQNKDSARKIADFLLQIKAIKLQPDKPFVWSSGIKSPIYCDNRKTLSYPKIRTYLRQQFTSVIQDEYGKPDVIGGIATGGIAHGVLVAQDMGLPFVYVRGEAKQHGTAKLIEGEIEAGQSVILIEDLVSTGGSSLKAAEALREEKCLVKGIISIFNYNLKIAEDNFKKAKVNLTSLCDYNTLIERALETNYITEKDLKPLEDWVKNPEGWKK
ncbi:MAG TPA: orotate phosphoribosyltransferase [Bacteroidia bacterium]|jgi:orotate phosphoribosyltransferase|nr:orotate phosphoribosyltransferase [Bacteroidia bacterium]